MTLSTAKEKIKAAIEIDLGKEDAEFSCAKRTYNSCIASIKDDNIGVDLSQWYGDMIRQNKAMKLKG